VVIISDLPASNGTHPLVASRPRGDVDHRVMSMMEDAIRPSRLVKLDVQGGDGVEGRDKGVMSIVDHILVGRCRLTLRDPH